MLDTPIALVFAAPYSKYLLVLFPPVKLMLPEAADPGDAGRVLEAIVQINIFTSAMREWC
jgi:hypothetical protein